MSISIAEAHNHLSKLLEQVNRGPVTITKRGKPVGILMSPNEYEQLRRVQAYLQILRLSESLKESGITAKELTQISREELEGGM